MVRILTMMLVVLVATTAHADPDDANKLFKEGLALQKEHKYPEACAKFARSYELDRAASRPAPGTQLNLGDCAEREGKIHRAYLLFDAAARDYQRKLDEANTKLAADPQSAEAKRDRDRAAAGVQFAHDRANALTPRLAKVVIRIAEPATPGLVIRVNDRTVPPAAEIVEYLDAGPVTITASAPGHQDLTRTATAEAGKQAAIEIGAFVDLGGGKIDTPATGRRNKKRVRIAIALGIGGGVLTAVSLSFGLSAKSQYDSAKKNCVDTGGQLMCPQNAANQIDKAGTKADVSTAMGIAGLLMIGGAAYVYFTAPKEVAVAPVATSTSAGVAILGRF